MGGGRKKNVKLKWFLPKWGVRKPAARGSSAATRCGTSLERQRRKASVAGRNFATGGPEPEKNGTPTPKRATQVLGPYMAVCYPWCRRGIVLEEEGKGF